MLQPQASPASILGAKGKGLRKGNPNSSLALNRVVRLLKLEEERGRFLMLVYTMVPIKSSVLLRAADAPFLKVKVF